MRVLALLVAASWVIPTVTHLLRIDILLLPLIVVSIASLLRVGSTALDRLILATGLAGGAALGAGMVFSVWPWGLNPVAVAGVFLTAIACTGVALDRRPSLPRRVAGSDLAVVGVGAVAGWVAMGPILHRDYFTRLGYITLTGDRTRHFDLFDTIHRIGGYTFLNYDAAKPMIDPNMGRTYPSGMHFLYALIDVFVTSHTSTGDAVSELSRYQWYVACGFAFFVACAAWAARWVLGPVGAGWRHTLAVTAVGTWLATGVMTTMLWCTWDPEGLGLGFFALLAAVCARPPGRIGAQLLLAGSLIVAVGFTYTPFLPFAYLMLLGSAVVYRKRLVRHWKATLITAIIALPLSLVESSISTSAGTTGGNSLLMTGFSVPIPRRTFIVLALLFLIGALAARQRRRPSTRALAGMTVLCLAGTAAIAYYQLSHIHQTTYYFEKTLHVIVVLALIGAAGALAVVGAGRVREPRSVVSRLPRASLVRSALSATAAAVAGALLAGSVGNGISAFNYTMMLPAADTTWGQVWRSGKQIYPTHFAALAFLGSKHMLGDGVPTLVIWDDMGTENVALSLITTTLNHQAGTLSPQVYGLAATDGLASAKAGPGGSLGTKAEQSLRALEGLIDQSPLGLRIVVSNPDVARRLTAYAHAEPSLRLKVVLLRELPPQRSPA